MTSDRGRDSDSKQTADEVVARCDSQGNRDLLALMMAQQAAGSGREMPTVASAKPVTKQVNSAAPAPGTQTPALRAIQQAVAARERK